MSIDFQKLLQEDTLSVARRLLGMQLLLNNRSLGFIVETEAYLGSEDAASHSFQGKRTPKNEAMYLAAGHWYVFQIYGHQMLNFVTQPENIAEAVLIRALEVPDFVNSANGPGKLTKYAGIDKRFNGQNMERSSLTLAVGREPLAISQRARIGITCGEPWKSVPLAFYVAGHSEVSKIKTSQITAHIWR